MCTAGNRATEKVVSGGVTTTTTYSYNTRGWLTTTVAVSGTTTTTVTYTYDQNGNQTISNKETVEPATGGTISGGIFAGNEYVSYYTYDVWNNMTQSVSENNTVENYYDGNGLRYGRKVDDGAMTVSLYEYDKVILEVNGTSGAQTAVNVYGNQLISRNGDYYMYNGHGDVTMIVNSSGTVLASYYYDAFGVHLSSAGTVSNPYRYAGYMFDEETGLYYLNSRYYDPETARFLSEDTYLGSASDPLSLNLYAYVKYNPLKYYDPTGHGAIGNLLSSFVNDPLKTLKRVIEPLLPVIVNEIIKTIINYTSEQSTVYEAPQIGTSVYETMSDEEQNKIKQDSSDYRPVSIITPDVTPYETKRDNWQNYTATNPSDYTAPLTVSMYQNVMRIHANINFIGDANELVGDTGYTYAELIVQGIIDMWSGRYYANEYDKFILYDSLNKVVEKYDYVDVEVTIDYYINYELPDTLADKFMNVYFSTRTVDEERHSWELDRLDTSSPIQNHISHVWQPDGWSRAENSIMHLFLTREDGNTPHTSTPEEFKNIVAHEFGHMLGLGDIYSDTYWEEKVSSEVPANDLMRIIDYYEERPDDSARVTSNDIEMIIEAWRTGNWQYYSISKVVRSGNR